MNQFLTQLLLDLEDIVNDVQDDAGFDSVAEHKLRDVIKQIETKQDEVQS
jgi:hypothetical protein